MPMHFFKLNFYHSAFMRDLFVLKLVLVDNTFMFETISHTWNVFVIMSKHKKNSCFEDFLNQLRLLQSQASVND